MSASTAPSFRHRLQIQTQALYPPGAPWPGGGVGTGSSPEPRSAVSAATTRPPLSPRGSSAAAATGQSRFVEGSMNDRVSAAPPAGFLGFDEPEYDCGLEQEGVSEGRYHLRRPRSTASWIRSSTHSQGHNSQGQQQQQHEARGNGNHNGVVKKSSSFLAPLWDGVREKLLLRGSKSSGSISIGAGRVVGGGDKKWVKGGEERDRVVREKPAAPAPPSAVGYPTREEVLESYKNLVASGFFEAHAIRGGRHPPRAGGNGPVQGNSFAEHVAGTTVPSPTGKSFADHMAAAKKQQLSALPFPAPTRTSMGPPPPPQRGSSRGKPDTTSSPHRGTKRGASLDLAGDAEIVTRKLVKKLRYSASRISMELTGARENHHHQQQHHHHHYYGYATLRSRPSTVANAAGGPLLPSSSVFGSDTSTPPATRTSTDGVAPIRHGTSSKLTKPKEPRRRRILGLTRRHRSPAAPFDTAATAAAAQETDHMDVDADTMMLDAPEPRSEPSKAGMPVTRVLTPPPLAFRSTHHHAHAHAHAHAHSYPQKRVSGGVSGEHGKPLSVVPDANQGIPLVPRIPREFCDAMAEMVPVTVAGTAVAEAAAADGKDGNNGGHNRDSGLGGEVMDVENIPVWG